MENKYPEHEKLHAIRDQSQILGEFLDWLTMDKRFSICEWNDTWGSMLRVPRTTESYLEEFFHIDGAKIDEEKRQMLEEIRKSVEK